MSSSSTLSCSPELLTGLGAALSMFLSALGSSLASAQAGIFAIRATTTTTAPYCGSKSSNSCKWNQIKAFFPIIIAGVLAIYGMIVSVILSARVSAASVGDDNTNGYRNLSAGLAVGLACLASGIGMARFLELFMVQHDAHTQQTMPNQMTQQPTTQHNNNDTDNGAEPLLQEQEHNEPSKSGIVVTWGFLCVLVFLEAIALYGLIVALFLMGK